MSISPSEKIKVAIDGNIATVMIDNPAANTWDPGEPAGAEGGGRGPQCGPECLCIGINRCGRKVFLSGAD